MKNIVKLERARINLSQQELAEKTEVSRQTIHSIESGKFTPSCILAIKIARVFELSVEEVFILEKVD
jgi:putative transcriptional regulator